MICEQVLYYSENCFGTADTIAFRYNTLRIHDLKTGVYPGSVHQLEVYAALFCLEYDKDPFTIKIELRLYQDNEVMVYDADPEDIIFIMGRIQEFDRVITHQKIGGTVVIRTEEEHLAHYGILRHSGRYPWGSGGTENIAIETFYDILIS